MTTHRLARIFAPSSLFALALVAAPAALSDPGHRDHDRNFKANLESFQEVPAVWSPAVGKFTAKLDKAGTQLDYELQYDGLVGSVTQAHIHFGQKSVNGAITVFLCTNLGNGPAGTQACPAGPATITGTIVAADVGNGAAAQGIAAGELDKLIEALREGVAYANVHSTTFPGGEIRGQIK